MRDKKGRFKKGYHASPNTEFKEGHIQSKESKQKMSGAHKGIKHSEKTKRKMGNALVGKFKEEKHWNWKGGRYIDDKKHIKVKKSNHPYSNSRGYIRESHLIAEKALGRYLKQGEIVHHNNINPSDNRNRNLLICTQSYHIIDGYTIK